MLRHEYITGAPVSIRTDPTLCENLDDMACTRFAAADPNVCSNTCFATLFPSECRLILYLATMNVYYVYPAISKSPKQLPNCLKLIQIK
jgi:hypothetical protein